MNSLSQMRAAQAAQEAAKTPAAQFKAAQLREGVAPSNLKPYSPQVSTGGQYGKLEPAGNPPVNGGLSAQLKMSGGYKKGGKVGSASKRADGIAKKGKTKGRMM